MNYYMGNVARLTDEEIQTLQDEIRDSGVLCGDPTGEGDEVIWAEQAIAQFDALTMETARRWALAHSIEAERREKTRTALAKLITAELASQRDVLPLLFDMCEVDRAIRDIS